MSKTTFSKKCEILGTIWTFYKDTENEGWQEYFRWSDLGSPIAYLVWQGLVTPKPEAKVIVEDTWNVFCGMIDIDPEGKYEDAKSAFDASPNKVLA